MSIVLLVMALGLLQVLMSYVYRLATARTVRTDRTWAAARAVLKGATFATGNSHVENPRSLRIVRGPLTIELSIGDTRDERQVADCLRCVVLLRSTLPRAYVDAAGARAVETSAAPYALHAGVLQRELSKDGVSTTTLVDLAHEATRLGEQWRDAAAAPEALGRRLAFDAVSDAGSKVLGQALRHGRSWLMELQGKDRIVLRVEGDDASELRFDAFEHDVADVREELETKESELGTTAASR